MASHFSPEQKMHMLQNAIHPEEELRQVKNQADQVQAFHGKGIGYNSYCNLLLSAASSLDAKHVPKGRMGSAKRNVYIHDLRDFEEDEFQMLITWTVTLVTFKPMSTGNKPRTLSSPEWDVKEHP